MGIWLIVIQENKIKVLGLILLLIPHIIGALQPEIHGFANTNLQVVEELSRLWHDFILQTSLANALLWIIIGGLSGYFTQKFIYSIDVLEEHRV